MVSLNPADCALIVMAKAPVAGRAKTRLIPALGADGAAALAERMLTRTLDAACTAGLGPVTLCGAPDLSHPAFVAAAARGDVHLAEQGEGDLGARMRRAIEHALATQAGALLIGTDAPALDAAYLRAAHAALAGHDAVLGPAHDGGYALIGLRRVPEGLFEQMPWSTSQVLALTRERLASAGLRWTELPALQDIDEPADLVHLALREAGSPWSAAALDPLPDHGLAHAHVRLVGTGVLARIPKQSQMGLDATENLRYQAACFERAAAGGHAPRLHGVLDPSAALPRGALLVEEIVGRSARLPQDLPAIAEALAAMHSLPLPTAAQRTPLLDAADPLVQLRAEIEAQAGHLDGASLATATRRAIDGQRAALAALCERPARPPRRLIAFDAHPGNFIVRPDGRAVLVDLEKARYSLPPLDLAHATLYTSTTWDRASAAVLTVDEVRGFHAHWAARCEGASAWADWIVPLRAAMWLWSLSWCAKWRVLSAQAARAGGDGEDWSAQRSEAALVDHVRERVDDYLSSAGVERVLAELAALAT